jgi:hypothetical protein
MGHCNGLNIVGHLFYSGLNTIKILLDQKLLLILAGLKIILFLIGPYSNGLPHQMLSCYPLCHIRCCHVIHCHVSLADVVDAATSDERAAGNRICDDCRSS